MQIRQIKVSHFRGIAALDWIPSHSFCCLIGPGDSGKSTVLDAVEVLLSPRWFSFTEPDFLGCDTSTPIAIEATIGELSRALKSDERFGLYVRGWTSAGSIRDEPEDDDEPVLTLRLTVDATMEPVWEMICERMDDPRTLSNRDRALFGLVRLAGEDEIEHGLEPHRIIGAIAQLKADQAKAAIDIRPVGHLLMTTHSDVALGEAGENNLYVIKTTRPDRLASITTPATPQSLRPLLRFTPRALFARRILVCEGYTEVGLLLGLREHWPTRHDNKPIEQLGAAIADGNGGEACAMALALAELGYRAALYRDSDDPLSADQQAKLAAAGIPVFEYGGGLYTELAIFSAATDIRVQELLQHAREERGDDFVDNNLAAKIDDLNVECIRLGFDSWDLLSTKNGEELRVAISEVAASKSKEKKDKKPWFKDQRIGRSLAPFVWNIASEAPASPLAVTLAAAEAWLYA